MSGFVFAHFVNGVVNSVIAQFLRAFCEGELTRGRAVLGFNADGEVLLCVGVDAFAQKLGEFRGVFGFFKGNALVCFGDFGIAFPVSLTAHCQIHSDFGAFAREVRAQALDNFRVKTLRDADSVLGNRFSPSPPPG